MLAQINDPETRALIEKTARLASEAAAFQRGYTLYFALFALGSGLLLGVVFLPKLENTRPSASPVTAPIYPVWLQKLTAYRGRIKLLGALLLLLLCAIAQQPGIDQNRGFIADREQRYEKYIKQLSERKDKEVALRSEYLYMPEGDSLIVMTLNNSSLAADYVWLTSMKYVSNSFRRGRKFEMLSRFYETMLNLDPHWIDAAVSAGKILSALEPNRFKVEEFYAHAVVRNPDNLKLFYEAGLLFVVPPQDPTQQAKYSARAVGWFRRLLTKLKVQPQTESVGKQIVEVEELTARLGIEAGYYKTSAVLLYKHATDPSNPEAIRSTAAVDWLTAHSLTLVSELNDLSDAHKNEHGQYPLTLDVLKAKLPNGGRDYDKDAFGFPLEYDPTTGDASSRGANARRAIQSAHIVNTILQIFHDTRHRHPHDLQELQTFVEEYFDAANPPSSALYDALGPKLNVCKGPLGEWNYDKEQGAVILPDYCNVKTLFHNAEHLWKK